MMAQFSVATFRTVGSAATTQNLFSIWNGSAKVVRIQQLIMQMDATVALAAVMPLVKTSRVAAAPGAGITLTKVSYDTGNSVSESLLVVKGECSVDGGSRTAITGTPGDVLWQQYGMRMHTVVGQVLGDNNILLPQPLTLRKDQGLIVHIVAAAGTSNPATNSYSVQCLWDESVT
jgi:hypothetical protein